MLREVIAEAMQYGIDHTPAQLALDEVMNIQFKMINIP